MLREAFAMVAPVAVEIPIINISGYLAGDEKAKGRIVDEFRNACENQGFLQVVGHSVPADLQSRFMASRGILCSTGQ